MQITSRTSATVIATSMVAVFMVNVTILMLGPLLVDIAHDLNVSVEVAGQLAASMAIPWVCVAFLAGALSDNYGRKPILLIGLIFMAMSSIGTGLSWNFVSALVFRGLLGFAGAVTINSMAVVSDYVSTDKRGKALGAITFGSGLGAALGIPIMAMIGDIYSWRVSFISVGVITSILCIFVMIFLPSSNHIPKNKFNFLAQFVPVIKQKVVWDISLVNFFSRTGLMIVMTFFSSFLILRHEFSTGDTAIPMAFVSGGIIFASMMGGSLADTKYRLLFVPFVMGISGILGASIFLFDFNPITLITLAALYMCVIYTPFPLIVTLLSLLGGKHLRGTTISMVPISNQGGVLVGPVLGGITLAIWDYEGLGILCLIIGLIGVLISITRLKENNIQSATKLLSEVKI